MAQSRFIITHPKKTDQTLTFIALDDEGNPHDWDSYISATAKLYISKLGEDPFATIESETLSGHDGQIEFRIANNNTDINNADVGEYVWWIVVEYQPTVGETDTKITQRGRFILYAPNWITSVP